VLAAVGGAVALLAPGIDRSKQSAAAAAARRDAAATAALVARATASQRLHLIVAPTRVPGPGAPAVARLQARAAVLHELTRAVLADARARVRAGTLTGPVLSVSCTPYPSGAVAFERALSVRVGSYACLAVNSAITSSRGVVGRVGDPFWARVDFATSRIAWCKINPRPGEQAIGAGVPSVPLAPVCDLELPAPGAIGAAGR
jgi:hypothetical protein